VSQAPSPVLDSLAVRNDDTKAGRIGVALVSECKGCYANYRKALLASRKISPFPIRKSVRLQQGLWLSILKTYIRGFPFPSIASATLVSRVPLKIGPKVFHSPGDGSIP
jgi:hypothetical protein